MLSLTQIFVGIRIVPVFSGITGNNFILSLWKGVELMANGITEEIKAVEEAAKQMIKDAKSESARMIAEARNEAEKRAKESKQKAYRLYKEKVSAVETQAAEKADKIVEEGVVNAKSFKDSHQGQIKGTATWIAEEVMAKYGRG